MSISGLGPALYGFHNPMSRIGIFPCVIFCLAIMSLYLLTIDIWHFAYTHRPECKNLTDLVAKNAGKYIARVHDLMNNLMLFINLIAIEIACSKMIFLVIGDFWFDIF